MALRRDKFTASDYLVLCSEHFKEAAFDRTEQIVRLKDGVISSVPASKSYFFAQL